MDRTLQELADLVGGTVVGNATVRIRGIAGLREAGPGDISFLASPKYAPLLQATRASAVVATEAGGAPAGLPVLTVRKPDEAFARIIEHFNGGGSPREAGIHPTAVISPSARIGRDVAIGAFCVVEEGVEIGQGVVLHPHVYLGRNVRLGADTVLHPGVVVREHCHIGSRVLLHSGCVIGSDGFGYTTVEGRHQKVPQVGNVVIEDDVELGANVCVARARFDKTIIHRGTKIDNLVHVAHNVEIGEDCLFAAQAGLAGSAKVGHHVMVGGQAGIGGHLEVGDRAVISAQAAVSKSLPAGSVVSGFMAIDHKSHLRQMASLRKLPDLLREFKKLQERVGELERGRKKRSS